MYDGCGQKLANLRYQFGKSVRYQFGSQQLASGGVGEMLLLAIGVDNGGEASGGGMLVGVA
jgi:hypothetical protein